MRGVGSVSFVRFRSVFDVWVGVRVRAGIYRETTAGAGEKKLPPPGLLCRKSLSSERGWPRIMARRRPWMTAGQGNTCNRQPQQFTLYWIFDPVGGWPCQIFGLRTECDFRTVSYLFLIFLDSERNEWFYNECLIISFIFSVIAL